MFTTNTNLQTGEYSASVNSMNIQRNQEGQPVFSLVLATETGDQVTISTKLNAFGIHEAKTLMNNLIDDFNLQVVEGLTEYNGEDVLPIMPMKDFAGFQHMSMMVEHLEGILKEFAAVLKISITGTERKRFEYLDMGKII